jgi:hypothetical protein
MAKIRQMISQEKLSDSELEELAEKLMARARQIRAERGGMTADEAVNAALKEMSEEAATLNQLKRRSVWLGNKAFSDELGRIQSAWGDRPQDGLAASYVGSNELRRGAQRSVDADQKGLARDWRNGLDADIERDGKGDLYRTGDLDEDSYVALDEMYKDNPNMEGVDKDARSLAAIIYKYQEMYRIAANHAGAYIKRLADYITHQNHDMLKVRDAMKVLGKVNKLRPTFKYNEEGNYRAWRDFVMPLLDQVKTFGSHADPEKWLRHFWQNIATGEHLQAGTTTSTGFIADGSLANRLSAPRLLHFKDGKSRYQYDKLFGRGGTLLERVSLGLETGAHNVALMQRMGPNPAATHTKLKTAVQLLMPQTVMARDAGKWRETERFLDAYFDELTGEANMPGLSPFSYALRMGRLIQTVSKLGSAAISSITDTAVAASELQYQGMTATEAWKTQLDGVFMGRGSRGMVRAERMRLASELGVAIDVIRSATWSRFSAQDALSGWAARGQHLFFKYNGLMWWTDTLRMANAMAMSHRFGMMSKLSLRELDAGAQRIMTLFDITSDEWDLMRSRSVDAVEGKEYFSPKGAKRITDVEIASLLEKEGVKATDRAIASRRDLIQTKFRDIFAARSDYAVVTPGPRTTMRMRGANIGIVPGSFASEAARSFFQFKGFPLAILEKVYGRELFGYGDTGLARNVNKTGMGKMAQFMVYSTFLGFTALYLKAYFSGRRLESPEDAQDAAKLFIASFVQGGGAGLYGDFLFGNARDRFGHSALSSFLGPTAGVVEDLYSGTRLDSLFEKAKSGDVNAFSMFMSLKNNAPFINLFYTRMALDYMFLYRMQEYLKPGSLKRMEENVKKNLNQTFALPPSNNYRVEDLSTEDLGKLLNPF